MVRGMESYAGNPMGGLGGNSQEILKKTMMEDLPVELLMQIFQRATIKSLYRGICVCKLWYKLITIDRLPFTGQPIGLLLESVKKEWLHLFQFKVKSSGISFDKVSIETWTPTFEMGTSDYKVNKSRRLNFPNFKTVNSCNGLICCVGWDEIETEVEGLRHPVINYFVVSNPIMAEYTVAVVPLEESHLERHQPIYAFGYCSMSNQYKILRWFWGSVDPMDRFYFESDVDVRPIHKLYTLGQEDNSWRAIADIDHFNFDTLSSSSSCVYLESAVHWAGWLHHPDRGGNYHFCILYFNFDIEKYGGFSCPLQVPYSASQKTMSMGVIRGCFCVSDWTSDGRFEIWVMKRYGIEESWTRELVIHSFSPSLVSMNKICRPLKFAENGKLLLLQFNNDLIFFYDTLNKSFVQRFRVPQQSTSNCCIVAHSPTFISLKDIVMPDRIKAFNFNPLIARCEKVNENNNNNVLSEGNSWAFATIGAAEGIDNIVYRREFYRF